MTTIQNLIDQKEIPVFPATYREQAKEVVAHSEHKRRRGNGRNPSMTFLEVRNPRKALEEAKVFLEKSDTLIRDRLMHLKKLLPGQQAIIYDFARYLAQHINSELVPQGFILGAVLALGDAKAGKDSRTGKVIPSPLGGQPPQMYAILNLYIPTIAKAVFPQDFAGHVSRITDNIAELVKQRHEAEKAAAPKPTIEGDPLQIYAAARAIADLAYQFWVSNPGDPEKPWLEDRREGGVNPFYDQTTGGLFLEIYYGIPGKIWTPWGSWNCWGSGSGSGPEAMEQFLASIGEIELFMPKHSSAQGEHGPVYAIRRVGDIVLPEPKRRERPSYFEYKEANRLWKETVEQYQAATATKH